MDVSFYRGLPLPRKSGTSSEDAAHTAAAPSTLILAAGLTSREDADDVRDRRTAKARAQVQAALRREERLRQTRPSPLTDTTAMATAAAARSSPPVPARPCPSSSSAAAISASACPSPEPQSLYFRSTDEVYDEAWRAAITPRHAASPQLTTSSQLSSREWSRTPSPEEEARFARPLPPAPAVAAAAAAGSMSARRPSSAAPFKPPSLLARPMSAATSGRPIPVAASSLAFTAGRPGSANRTRSQAYGNASVSAEIPNVPKSAQAVAAAAQLSSSTRLSTISSVAAMPITAAPSAAKPPRAPAARPAPRPQSAKPAIAAPPPRPASSEPTTAETANTSSASDESDSADSSAASLARGRRGRRITPTVPMVLIRSIQHNAAPAAASVPVTARAASDSSTAVAATAAAAASPITSSGASTARPHSSSLRPPSADLRRQLHLSLADLPSSSLLSHQSGSTVTSRPDSAMTGGRSSAVSSRPSTARRSVGRLHLGGTVSGSNTARSTTAALQSSRSVASSIWPASQPTTARSSFAAHAADPGLHSYPPPAVPLVAALCHPLVEELAGRLHAAAKDNDIEAALVCLQRLQRLKDQAMAREDRRHDAATNDEDDEEKTNFPAAAASPGASPSGPSFPVLSDFSLRFLCDRNGSTPLFHTAWHDHTTLSKLLLDSRWFHASQRNVRGNSALDLAIERSNLGSIQLLLAYGAKLSSDAPHLRSTDDAAPGSMQADKARVETLALRATYELSPECAAYLDRRNHVAHKALKLSYYVRSNSVARLAQLFESNPASTSRWLRDFSEGGMTLLGLACRFGHAQVARMILAREPQLINVPCIVRKDGRMVEEVQDDDDDDSDAGSDVDESDAECYTRGGRTRPTNAFALALEHGHFGLALDLFAAYGASIEHSPELCRASALDESGTPDPEMVRASLEEMQALATVSGELQARIIDAATHGADDSDALRSWLEARCASTNLSLESVISFPDLHGRCALHLTVSYRLPRLLDYLLAAGGFRRDLDRATQARRSYLVPSAAVAPHAFLSSHRDLLRRKTLVELALETNHLTIIYLLLGVGASCTVAQLIRALDRVALPHSRLTTETGLLILGYLFESLRNAARILRAHREHKYAVACEVARSEGRVLPPLPPPGAILDPEELLALINSTEVDADTAERILRLLLPMMQADAAERAALEPIGDFQSYLRRLHAWQLAHGKPVLSEEDRLNGSSGYGRSNSGLASARGRGHDSSRRGRLNRMHDAAYLARMLARQRAHAEKEAMLWASMHGKRGLSAADQLQATEDQLMAARMEASRLDPLRIQHLLSILSELQAACADDVPVPLTAEEIARQHALARNSLHAHDMMSAESVRHQAAVKAAARAAKGAFTQAPGTAGLTAEGDVDWKALATRGVGAKQGAAESDSVESRRARLCFRMDELLEYNPRLQSLLPSPSVRTHTTESWLRAWQAQAWDEGLGCIDILVRERGRRMDPRKVARRDWLPLAFLWRNRWSQRQAELAEERRQARWSRINAAPIPSYRAATMSSSSVAALAAPLSPPSPAAVAAPAPPPVPVFTPSLIYSPRALAMAQRSARQPTRSQQQAPKATRAALKSVQ